MTIRSNLRYEVWRERCRSSTLCSLRSGSDDAGVTSNKRHCLTIGERATRHFSITVVVHQGLDKKILGFNICNLVCFEDSKGSCFGKLLGLAKLKARLIIKQIDNYKM